MQDPGYHLPEPFLRAACAVGKHEIWGTVALHRGQAGFLPAVSGGSLQLGAPQV